MGRLATIRPLPAVSVEEGRPRPFRVGISWWVGSGEMDLIRRSAAA